MGVSSHRGGLLHIRCNGAPKYFPLILSTHAGHLLLPSGAARPGAGSGSRSVGVGLYPSEATVRQAGTAEAQPFVLAGGVRVPATSSWSPALTAPQGLPEFEPDLGVILRSLDVNRQPRAGAVLAEQRVERLDQPSLEARQRV